MSMFVNSADCLNNFGINCNKEYIEYKHPKEGLMERYKEGPGTPSPSLLFLVCHLYKP